MLAHFKRQRSFVFVLYNITRTFLSYDIDLDSSHIDITIYEFISDISHISDITTVPIDFFALNNTLTSY